MREISRLKQYAYELKAKLNKAGWFKRIGLKIELVKVLDEIDYQEGRLQFANRPYSFPPARLRNEELKHDHSCKCGCWKAVRIGHFGM